MLHIQQPGSVTALWGVQGWPPLADWAEHPDLPLLYWALREISPAVEVDDLDVVDDLLAEIAVWLDRILRRPVGDPIGHPDLVPVLTLLWGEMQLGRGAGDLLQLKVNAALACKATAPAVATTDRPDVAVPPYVPGPDRIRGGHLPLVVDVPVGAADRPAHELFLLELAGVLSNGGGHLSEFVAPRAPDGSLPGRTGWASAHQGAAGELLGSLRSVPDEMRMVLLRPGASLRAVQAAGRGRAWTVEGLGRALAAAWLVDTTLIVDEAVQRRDTVDGPVVADADPEPLWQLPLEVFHPDQFGRLRPGPPRAGLRAVPDPR